MPDSLIANVLCSGQISFALEDVVRVMQDQFGSAARLALPIPGRDGSGIINMGPFNVLVMIEDKPLPLEVPQQDSITSPSGASPLLNHRTHAMVSLLNVPEDQAEKMRSVLRLVQVVSSVASCAAVSAVMWSASGTLLPVKQFQDLTAQWTASADVVPTLLICRVLAYRDGVDEEGLSRHGVFSVGLESFIGKEVELAPQPIPVEAMVQNFHNVANYLLRTGQILGDGDTITVPSIGRVSTRLGSVRGGEAGSLIICDIDRGAFGQGAYH